MQFHDLSVECSQKLGRRLSSDIVASAYLPQAFIDARYKNPDRPTTDEEITGLLIAALFAGQHTSSITSTWTGFYLHA